MTRFGRAVNARAWVRPTLALFLFRTAAGFVISYPAMRVLGAFGPATSPDDDLRLFAPGGQWLLEALRLGGRAVSASFESAGVATIVACFFGLLPVGVALAALVHPGTPNAGLLDRAARKWPVLVFLFGCVVLAQALVATSAAVLISQLAGVFGTMFNERNADLCVVAVAGIAALAIFGLGVLQDLARVAIVRDGAPTGAAITAALRTFVVRPKGVVGGILAPVLASAVLVMTVAWSAGKIDVSRPGPLRILAVFGVHQATVFALAAFRVRWLSTAVDLVEAPCQTEASVS